MVEEELHSLALTCNRIVTFFLGACSVMSFYNAFNLYLKYGFIYSYYTVIDNVYELHTVYFKDNLSFSVLLLVIFVMSLYSMAKYPKYQ